jgi:hypothetical protein
LISGVQLDLKGAWTTTGDQKIAVYMKDERKLFMVGRVSDGLYRLDVRPIEQPDLAPNSLPPPLVIDPVADPSTSANANANVNLAPLTSVQPSINLSPTLVPADSADNADPASLPDPGIFAVPSLVSIYQQPSEEDNLKFFSTV